MSESRGKKRPKSYYRKSAHSKRQKLNSLAAGMRGFLVTCNNNEKQAVRESYNILNEYADDLYGPEQHLGKKDADSDDSVSEDEDMEKAMAREVKAIKEKPTAERRFQNTDTSAKNCIFIRTTLEDPAELHHKIFSDLFEKKVSKARFVMRMLPIAGSCKAVLSEVKTLAEEILPKYFPSGAGEEKTYSVIFKVRNNNSISRDSVLPLLGDVVKSLNPLNRVNCDNPDVCILVEILCSVCCLGVSKDFYKFRKYNLHEVVKDTTKPVKETELKQKESKEEEHEDEDDADTATEEKTDCEVAVNVEKEEKEIKSECFDSEVADHGDMKEVLTEANGNTVDQKLDNECAEVADNQNTQSDSTGEKTEQKCKSDSTDGPEN